MWLNYSASLQFFLKKQTTRKSNNSTTTHYFGIYIKRLSAGFNNYLFKTQSNVSLFPSTPLCLNGWVLLDLEDDGSHAGDVARRLGRLRVEVAELGDPLPLRAGLHLPRLGHQLLLSRSGGREWVCTPLRCVVRGIFALPFNWINGWIKGTEIYSTVICHQYHI